MSLQIQMEKAKSKRQNKEDEYQHRMKCIFGYKICPECGDPIVEDSVKIQRRKRHDKDKSILNFLRMYLPSPDSYGYVCDTHGIIYDGMYI